ncbi:hypothetical protein M427DRAFT_46119 [Gonapodya prolifera JEL478]|uniref:Uncharacterized protein n=1 Tax=Gonapodya prolifera (strain JEL478) TaxID=1344416 RepID=A0A139A854_GONPJ|nr:hypothetical protein M427DRAFT_46119 [Gonapodya prolifera JEL478]|eukprot:KXS12884.1 hypothetical protein M427DRAFT_46119 [Gonapodya prolifera JEL478]
MGPARPLGGSNDSTEKLIRLHEPIPQPLFPHSRISLRRRRYDSRIKSCAGCARMRASVLTAILNETAYARGSTVLVSCCRSLSWARVVFLAIRVENVPGLDTHFNPASNGKYRVTWVILHSKALNCKRREGCLADEISSSSSMAETTPPRCMLLRIPPEVLHRVTLAWSDRPFGLPTKALNRHLYNLLSDLADVAARAIRHFQNYHQRELALINEPLSRIRKSLPPGPTVAFARAIVSDGRIVAEHLRHDKKLVAHSLRSRNDEMLAFLAEIGIHIPLTFCFNEYERKNFDHYGPHHKRTF